MLVINKIEDLQKFLKNENETIIIKNEWNTCIVYVGKLKFSMTNSCSSISCGVMELYRLPSNTQIKELKSKFKQGFEKEGINKLFEFILEGICDWKRKSFILLSDTQKGGIENSKIFDEICTTSTNWERNKNTSSKIKTWIYTKK